MQQLFYKYSRPAGLGLILILTSAVYAQIAGHEFLDYDFDDFLGQYRFLALTKENVINVFTKDILPVTHLTHSVMHHFFGSESAAPHHLLNLLFHLFNTAFVYLFIKKLAAGIGLKRGLEISFICTFLFALHPMHVEAVAWIMGRKDVVYTFFFVPALIVYLDYLKNGKYLYLFASFFLFWMSLFSKNMAIPLSITLIAIDILYKRKLLSVKVIAEKIPFLLLAFKWGGGFYYLGRIIDFGADAAASETAAAGPLYISGFPLIERITFAFYGTFDYLSKLIFPNKLSLIYPYPIALRESMPYEYYFFPVIILTGALVLFWFRRDIPHILFGSLFFIFNIFLTLHLVIAVTTSVINDRYTYVAGIGIFYILAILYAQACERFPTHILKFRIITGIYLLMLTTYTFFRIGDWKDTRTVWLDITKKYPTAAQAWNGLGKSYSDSSQNANAAEAYKKAVALLPYYSDAHYNLGNMNFTLQKYDAAVQNFTDALTKGVRRPVFYYNRGNAKFYLKDYIGAIQDYIDFMNTGQGTTDGLYNRGICLMNLGRQAEACLDFQQAASKGHAMAKSQLNSYCQGVKPVDFTNSEPELASYDQYYNRGNVKYNAQKHREAIADYDKALEKNPACEACYYNRGNSKLILGRSAESILDYDAALKLKPDWAEPYFNRAVAKQNLGQKEASCADFAESERLGYAPAAQKRAEKLPIIQRLIFAGSVHRKLIFVFFVPNIDLHFGVVSHLIKRKVYFPFSKEREYSPLTTFPLKIIFLSW